jgi:hypothetical protein
MQDESGGISAWQDQSGNGFDAVQSDSSQQPQITPSAINGLPAVYFDGNNRFFTLPDVISGATAGELFVVLKTEGDQNAPHGFMRFSAGGNSGGPGTDILYPYQGQIYDAFGSTSVKLVGSPNQPLTEYHLYNATSKSNEWSARINGKLQYRTSSNTVGFTATPTIGALYYSFQGKIAEILVYDHALVDSERERVQWYLAAKYFVGDY